MKPSTAAIALFALTLACGAEAAPPGRGPTPGPSVCAPGWCQPYSAATNYVIASQDMVGGSWIPTDGLGSYGCTLTAGYPAPPCSETFNVRGCGLNTATRLVCPAVLAGALQIVYQDGSALGTHSGGIYAYVLDGGAQVADLQVGGSCVRCAADNTPRRCVINSASTASSRVAIGLQGGTNNCASGARAALDIIVWQGDRQNVATLTPPIVTSTTSEFRDAGCVRGATKILIGMGDSITYNGNVPSLFAEALNPGLGIHTAPFAWVNGGVPGDTCAQVRARWPALRDAYNPTHLSLMCGVNDIRTGVSAATAWSNFEWILNDARSRGIRVRPILPLNFEGASDYDATKGASMNTLRASVQAWCTARGVACANPAFAANDAGIQVALSDGGYSNAIKAEFQDTADGIHLNAAGRVRYVALVMSSDGGWPTKAAEGWNP